MFGKKKLLQRVVKLEYRVQELKNKQGKFSVFPRDEELKRMVASPCRPDYFFTASYEDAIMEIINHLDMEIKEVRATGDSIELVGIEADED